MIKPPCENQDCDLCHPAPRWNVSTETLERRVHEREIKAATREEALRIYEEGTAWPSDYDTRTVQVLEEGPVVVEPAPPRRKYSMRYDCWHFLECVCPEPPCICGKGGPGEDFKDE
jgi:hypothetical protein